MTILLKCQEKLVKPSNYELRAFGIALLCHLLEIFESDLTPAENLDINNFIKEWNDG